MAELSESETLPIVAGCCSPAVKSECCEPEAKSECCGEDDSGCGCSEGRDPA